MSTLASLSDVTDILQTLPGGYDGSQDARLQQILDSTEDWMRRVYGLPDYICATSATDSFFGYKDGSILNLSDPNPTDIVITFVDYATNDEMIILPPPQYTLMPNGRLWLKFIGLVAPFEGAVAAVRPSEMARIDVTFVPSLTSTNKIPPALREAVALTAAFTFKQEPLMMGGLRSEAIGSYSYVRDISMAQLVMPPRARALMRPFDRRRFIQVT
jgi:hypothetical protein